MKIKLTYGFLFLFGIITAVFGQDNKKENPIQKEIARIASDPDLKHAAWGVSVLNTSDGKVVAEYNSEMGLIPASTLKLLTTATAYAKLKSNYKFTTTLSYDGAIDSNGTLNGNIYIIGGGDPTLGSTRFENTAIENVFSAFYEAIKTKGITNINGSVIGDDSYFEENFISPTWQWGDMGNYYGSGATGLSIFENAYTLTFHPGDSIGKSALISSITPAIPDIKFVNRVKTAKAGSGDNVVIYGSPYSNERMLTGTIPIDKANFTVKGSIPNPALCAAQLFSDYLKKKNINIEYKPFSLVSGDTLLLKAPLRKTLTQWQSPSLESIIRLIHLHSINNYTDAILKTISREANFDGSYISATSSILNYWNKKGLDIEGIEMNDGCGLSPLNRISPHQMSEFLYLVSKEEFFQTFYYTLAVAGKSGTLASILKGTVAENNMRGKSGYMTNTRAYCGYVTNKNKQFLCFSVIMNNFNGTSSEMKKKIEKLLLSMALSQ
ncbi:MAG: D-alanyl-D-alanine carboxypeptidase/D-alanyl-D-alanine-endopeptidase [Bacteroidota bacterium]